VGLSTECEYREGRYDIVTTLIIFFLLLGVIFSDEWSKLLETVELRDEKLVAAGEIHRFNRDVAESLSRIQEKYVAIPDDLGRDLNSVLGLIRRHENFETDLVALEAQLQVRFIHDLILDSRNSVTTFSFSIRSDPGG
jgi:hypothetical protein